MIDKRDLPKKVLNGAIFISRFLKSPKFISTKVGFFKYNYYNFKEFILGKKDFFVEYGKLKFHLFGREILNEKNELTYSRLKHCKNVLDLGGYIGDTALFLSEKNKNVYVFEPEKEKIKYLKINIKINKKENQIFPYAFAVVANNVKKINIYKDSDYDVASTLYSENPTSKKRETVNCMHIREVLKIANFDGMKCDIEGEEWNLIKWLIKNKKLEKIKKIIFELHFSKKIRKWDEEFKNLLKYLKNKKIKHKFLYCNGGKEIKNPPEKVKEILNKKYVKEGYSLMLYILN